MNFSRHGDLSDLARVIRIRALQMIHSAKSSHIGSSFSVAELLAVLYGRILRINPDDLDCQDRDRFIFSKGHACAALYAVLAEIGFFHVSELETFYRNGSRLAGHASHFVPGVEVSTGSLGHGLPLACGMALVGREKTRPFRAFALLSDGECDEGSTWEAILFAGHHKLDNLTAIIDYNKIQSLGSVNETLALEPFAQKWRACHWTIREIDGHNVEEIECALREVPFQRGYPSCLIAHTTKGKGVSFMENQLLWHYRAPNESEFAKALRELTARR
ncbi:MAG TPA: transketolase [Candidatus Acidoferrales bacterium]|nr:transketolase [Candidatus Acidoferrales bacterium]